MELGHHDSRITFAHYRELVKPKEAARYWDIKPSQAEKIVQLVAQHRSRSGNVIETHEHNGDFKEW